MDFLAAGAIDGCDAGSELEEGLALCVGVTLGDGSGTTADASCVNLTFNVGDEKVNPAALKCIQPLFSLTIVVAIFCWAPSDDVTLTVADTGAVLNL